MQFSHLTIYCFCVLSTIYRCGYLLKAAAKKEDWQNCIVTRVCVLTEPGKAADCAEKVFTSENASDVGLRLSMETCIPHGQAWPDIDWFMEQPVQRWVAECWNQTQCRIPVEVGSRQVWIGVALGMRKERHSVLVPQACSLTVTSHTGKVKVFHGEGEDLGCGNEGSLGTLTDDNTGRVLWMLPVSVHHNFHTHIAQGRKEEFVDRDKRDTEGEDIDFLSPASGKTFRPFQPQVKDIIFSDIGDSSDMFTGELTPDEEVWNADLPETLGSVMTFPDDYMERMGLSEAGKTETKGQKSEKWGLKNKVLPPVKEMPQFSPSNNLLPMKTVEEAVGGEPQPTPSPQGLEGRDMMMALEENIDNKLHSSLSSLLQDQQTRNKEELSLVASLALENKVSDVLASVEKEPNSILTSEGKEAVIKQQRPVAGHREDNEEEQPAPVLSKQAENNKSEEGDNGTKVETLAKSLPPPDQTLSSVSKPRLPPPNTTKSSNKLEHRPNSTQTSTNASLPNNNTAVTNLSSNSFNQSDDTVFNSSLSGNASSNVNQSGSANADPSLLENTIATTSIPMDMADSGTRGGLMSPQPPPGPVPGRQKGIKPALSPSDQQTLKGNVLKAEALFQKSFDHLKVEMMNALHVSLRPSRKKLLNAIDPGVLRWGHTTAWAMVKQVCKDALLKMRTGDSSWQEWSLWSPCTLTCGHQGYQVRHRNCRPLHECLGSNYDLRTCDSQPPCQESSAWLAWAEWGHCSVTCGSGGVQFRMRTCLTGDPVVVCQGSGTEFTQCSPPPCAVMNNATMSNQQDPKRDHHPRKKHVHFHHHHHHSHPKKETKTHPPITIPKPSTTTTTTTTTISPDQPDHRKRKKRPHGRRKMGRRKMGRRKMLARRPRGPDNLPPDQLETIGVLDDVMNDLQGVEVVKDKDNSKKSDMMPLEAYETGKLQNPLVPKPQPRADDSSEASWSVWGMWSQCSVSCDRGTEFRRRQCIKRKEDSLDGQPVNTVLCTGKSKDKRNCVLFPCPISVAVPKTLAMLNEGNEGRLSCRHDIKGKVRFMYWITPSGEVINNSTEDGKYVMQGNILSIHRAQKSDLGHYQCVLVGFSNIGLPGINKSSEAQTDKEELGTCLENPCENGGTCEDDLQPHEAYAQIAPFHYRCICPEGFFGKHCEQKSLVHQYTPNLKIMGLVLLGLIALLFITCTVLCVYYRIEGKKEGHLDLGPVMTRRRSEDQWRKMKSFDQKERSRKKSFSAKAIRRLSRILTGKQDDNEKDHTVRFGLNTSPYSELAKSMEDSGTDVEELWNDLTRGTEMKDVPEIIVDNVSQNASPVSVVECDSECESPGELPGNQAQSPDFQDSERYQSEITYSQNCQTESRGTSCPTKFQDTERYHSKCQSAQRHADDSDDNKSFHSDDRDCLRYKTEAQDNPNRVIIQLHDSKLYVDFQGDQKQTVKFPSKQECQNEQQAIQFQDSQKQSLQPVPTIIYSDDKMEIFSDSSLLHLKGLEDRLKQESYSPFLGSCEESPMNPTTYIYRSQVSLDPRDVDLSSVPSAVSDRPRCKRRSKKWSRRTSSVEHEFNQNNSDDSNDSNHQPSGEQTGSEEMRSTNHAADHAPSPSGQRSSRSDRGHQSASCYSSTDSGEESDNVPEGVSGRWGGARPKVRHGPWHKVRSNRPRTSTADTQARGGQNSPQSHTLFPVQDRHRQATYSTKGSGTAKPAYMMYEVHHPDEPYPFKQARSRRKSREGAEGPGSGPTRRSAESSEQMTPDSSMRRLQDTLSPSTSAQNSMDTGVHQQRPSATSPQPLRYLEGGGEGALAPVRTDSRKSGRDVLLRRAMENSFIQATTGHEPWRPAFPNRKRSASPDGDSSESSDLPRRSQSGQPEQSVASAAPESLSSPQLLSDTFGIPHVRRTEHQPGLTPWTQPLAAPASSHHHLIDHARLEDSMVAGSISPQLQSNPHFTTPVSSFLHQAHKTHQQKGKADRLSGHSGDKFDAADWFNFTKKAGVSSDSFNLFQPRTHTLEADSDAPSASGSGSVFSSLNPASTSRETRRTVHDRAAEEDVVRTPVSSPSEAGRAWRQARLITETRSKNNVESQPPPNNRPSMDSHSETSKDQTSTSASTSAVQHSSSVLLGQFSMSDCLHRSQTKILKSALKQRCSQSKLAPAETKAQPLRRVSFSEPHIHIHNSIDSVLEEGRQQGLRWSSDVSMGSYQNTASSAQNDSSVDRHWGRCAFPQLDTLSAALPSAVYGEQVFPPTSGRGSFNQPSSSSSSPTGSSWLSSFLSSKQESVLRLSDNRQDRARGSSRHPTGTNTNASGPPSSSSRNCCPSGTAQARTSAWASSESSALSRTTETTAESEDQTWSLQSSLLVDIEPNSSAHTDFRSADSVSTDRGNNTAPQPPVLSSQGLLTPLTPCPAQDNPSRAGQQDREWQSDVRGGGGEGSGRTDTAETRLAGPNLPTELGLSSAVSVRSFQEMLAQRSPGAFFRPIDRTDRPHQSHH